MRFSNHWKLRFSIFKVFPFCHFLKLRFFKNSRLIGDHVFVLWREHDHLGFAELLGGKTFPARGRFHQCGPEDFFGFFFSIFAKKPWRVTIGKIGAGVGEGKAATMRVFGVKLADDQRLGLSNAARQWVPGRAANLTVFKFSYNFN